MHAGGVELRPSGELMLRNAAGSASAGAAAPARKPPAPNGVRGLHSTAAVRPDAEGRSSSKVTSGGRDRPPPHLFAYPAESNFSGVRYAPSLAAAVRCGDAATALVHGAISPGGAANAAAAVVEGHGTETCCGGRWLVMLDAAKACGTSPPDLSASPVDFVVSTRCMFDRCPVSSPSEFIAGRAMVPGLLPGRAVALQATSRESAQLPWCRRCHSTRSLGIRRGWGRCW